MHDVKEKLTEAEKCLREAVVEEAKGNHEKAVEKLTHGLHHLKILEPTKREEDRYRAIHRKLLAERSDVFAHERQWEQALTDANTLLEECPDWSHTHACHAAALKGHGQLKEAEDASRS